jgi:hypothetical protein
MPAAAEKPRGKKPKWAGRCPVCGHPTVAELRPFCSARCKDLDLGRWLKEAYRIPTDEEPKPGDGAHDEE